MGKVTYSVLKSVMANPHVDCHKLAGHFCTQLILTCQLLSIVMIDYQKHTIGVILPEVTEVVLVSIMTPVELEMMLGFSPAPCKPRRLGHVPEPFRTSLSFFFHKAKVLYSVLSVVLEVYPFIHCTSIY